MDHFTKTISSERISFYQTTYNFWRYPTRDRFQGSNKSSGAGRGCPSAFNWISIIKVWTISSSLVDGPANRCACRIRDEVGGFVDEIARDINNVLSFIRRSSADSESGWRRKRAVEAVVVHVFTNLYLAMRVICAGKTSR